MTQDIYVLGGAQSDFVRNWAREELSIFDLFSQTIQSALQTSKLDPQSIEVGHVGNFEGSLYTGQSHLGGFFGHVDPAWQYLPASRHEAACASGSMAILAAMADLQSGRYQTAVVAGVEMMRTNKDDADRLKGAAWVGEEWQDASMVWPSAFSDLIDFYQEHSGVQREHLAAISEKNFANARRNSKAQSRQWNFPDGCFMAEDDSNPVIAGNIRRLDCGQVTDGAAVVFLATAEAAHEYARQRGLQLSSIPKIKGWAHINAPMLFSEKVRLSKGQDYPLPHVHRVMQESLSRADLNFKQIDGIELHDCFNITEYMILDHTGIRPQGEVWQAIEAGHFQHDGELPVNTSGGLIGLGHPVGATGVRMVLDAAQQVSGRAQDIQIAGANNMLTVNIGGSTTTCASFVVGA